MWTGLCRYLAAHQRHDTDTLSLAEYEHSARDPIEPTSEGMFFFLRDDIAWHNTTLAMLQYHYAASTKH